MAEPDQHTFKVAILWRGDAQARAEARPETSRLAAVFAALDGQGIAAEPAVYSDELMDQVREQLLPMDAVLVWVDPIAGDLRRTALDRLLRQLASAGIFVSAHPDVIGKMGVKEVLYATRELGWGSDTHLYETMAAFGTQFPARVAAGPRVLKQNRGNGGIGVWKVETVGAETVRVQEARREAEPQVMSLQSFMTLRREYFEGGGRLIDQPFQLRHLEGMVRCYMSGGGVVGFGRQLVRALAPPEAGPASPRLYSGPDDARFQRLRGLMEQDWTPAMVRRLDIDPAALPVIWDADFLLGPRTPEGEDSYVLCEINASSVFPIPDQAPAALAETLLQRLIERRNQPAAVTCRFPSPSTGDSHD